MEHIQNGIPAVTQPWYIDDDEIAVIEDSCFSPPIEADDSERLAFALAHLSFPDPKARNTYNFYVKDIYEMRAPTLWNFIVKHTENLLLEALNKEVLVWLVLDDKTKFIIMTIGEFYNHIGLYVNRMATEYFNTPDLIVEVPTLLNYQEVFLHHWQRRVAILCEQRTKDLEKKAEKLKNKNKK